MGRRRRRLPESAGVGAYPGDAGAHAPSPNRIHAHCRDAGHGSRGDTDPGTRGDFRRIGAPVVADRQDAGPANRTLDAKEAEAAAKGEAEAKAKLDEVARAQAEARGKLLAAVDEDYEKGRAHAREGLTEDNHGKALELMERALADGGSAMRKLDAIEKEKAADAELLAEAKARREKTVRGMVKIHVHRADLYMWRGSLPNAKKEIEAARALDPSNPDIAAAEERLLAADDDDTFETRYLREQRQSGSRFPSRGGRGGGGGGGGGRGR